MDTKGGGCGGGKAGGAMEHWKVLSATMAGWQETFSNVLEWLKKIIFWPSLQS